MNEENVVYLCSGILFNRLKKRYTWGAYRKMQEPSDHTLSEVNQTEA